MAVVDFMVVVDTGKHCEFPLGEARFDAPLSLLVSEVIKSSSALAAGFTVCSLGGLFLSG